MSDQPKALRLAEWVESDMTCEGDAEIAAELRRLHAENEALREANEAFGKRQEWWNEKMVALEALNAELVEALRGLAGLYDTDHGCRALPQYVAARAALAKAGASNG